MIRNTREAISHALAFAYEGATQTANYLDYLCPISISSSSQGLQIAMAVQSAKVRAAVNDQPSPISDVLLYNYGPDVEPLNKPLRHSKLASTVSKEAFSVCGLSRKAKRLEIIAYLAVEDFRIGILMGRELPVSVYLDAIEYSGSQWARDYEPFRRKALMLLQSYDKIGIAKVSIVCKSIRESEENS